MKKLLKIHQIFKFKILTRKRKTLLKNIKRLITKIELKNKY
jgi:hypothetical protein